ncbi:hypothetical protein [Dyadobacter psychrotolerans]|uniref:Lipoprotein n=1 Tax=Dyadobacter psychrotolerans TaxID=2541721 RepID=A0A4R5DUF4_9BACT|nr:hypothetical protein [Dyadobacter psychrotolerans]TDE14573.1 hypothetical protein E0F88_15375 [Dyadobacter psychrotolerans]
MQKLIKTIISGSAYTAVMLVLSCGGKDSSPNPLNCGSNSDKVSAAAMTYVQSPTKANCEAYKNVVKDFYKSCASFYTGSAKQALDEFLAEPCPN